MDNSGGVYHSDGSNQYPDDDDGGVGFSLRNSVVDELNSDWKKNLKIDNNDNRKRDILYEEEEEEEEEDDEDLTEALMAQMGYGKTKPAEEEGEDEDITDDLLNQMGYGKTRQKKHEPPATPIPADNLKSAMKDRIKKDKEKKVRWAEDVYDPIPSAPSHLAANKIERHNRSENKKSGKNKQNWGIKGRGGGAKSGKDEKKRRGGGAKGGKDKDNKQVKNFGGSSSKKCFHTLD
ncbi:hypothetical protein M9H77_05977 [Catharanthus roseus]|uniref:Uncharacterized protein n=1 Tax=Catharanthus roseus TaxID=4058 RepID=A0ACC0BR12_CATRO|nr:hypothetical protein M9H77_05977 [Catharanthus roseus]